MFYISLKLGFDWCFPGDVLPEASSDKQPSYLSARKACPAYTTYNTRNIRSLER